MKDVISICFMDRVRFCINLKYSCIVLIYKCYKFSFRVVEVVRFYFKFFFVIIQDIVEWSIKEVFISYQFCLDFWIISEDSVLFIDGYNFNDIVVVVVKYFRYQSNLIFVVFNVWMIDSVSYINDQCFYIRCCSSN